MLEHRINLFTHCPGNARSARAQQKLRPSARLTPTMTPSHAAPPPSCSAGPWLAAAGRDVVGSGIMAERLAGGNAAVALLANTAATVAVLAP